MKNIIAKQKNGDSDEEEDGDGDDSDGGLDWNTMIWFL